MSQAPEASQVPVTTARASLRELDRRRSERLLITVPIQVEGVDREGEKFTEETQTIVINRQGARIHLRRHVAVGAMLMITTRVAKRSAKFRVVGPTQPPGGDGGEWGLECQDSICTIWGIGFPPPSASEGACTALLECRRCHAVKLCHLSLVEHEVLGTSGLLVKECEACGRSTSWSYKEPSIAVPSDDTGPALPSTETLDEQQAGANRRIHNRVALQLPVRVRSFYGAEEITRSENVSRSGMCFITDRNYEVGEVILVTCPFEKGGHNIEMRGHVARRREMQGTGRKIYGISYER
ncbi:MAG: PilZ domain-containing protein [Acidobacteriota bacterium]|nr:PilZ domain-containing protein [Acidobacteriota bacterium]